MQRRGTGAWSLVGLVLTAWLLAMVATWLGVAPTAGSTTTDPATVGPSVTPSAAGPGEAPVVVIGVPGLTWDQLSRGTTPGMAGVYRPGGAAALVMRGTHEVTCPADAWLTIGAGQRAATTRAGCAGTTADGAGDPDGATDDASDPAHATGASGSEGFPTDTVPPDVPSGESADADEPVDALEWQAWQAAAQQHAMAPRLGTLADTVEEAGSCVAAYGAMAAVGAARGDGTLASYHHRGLTEQITEGAVPPPISLPHLDPRCRVHLIGAPALQASETNGQLGRIDDAVAMLLTELPEDATLLLVSTGHTDGRPDAGVLALTPVQVRDGAGATLSSGSTRQRSLVQLTDLTPTILHAAGVPLPDHLAGQPVTASPQERSHSSQARHLAAGISGAKQWAPWVLGFFAVLLVPLLGAALVMGWRGLTRLTATAAIALPVATFTAGWVPWWASDRPLMALLLSVTISVLVVSVIALAAGALRARHPLGPPAVVGAITLIVLGADALMSARLGLVSVLGLQPVTAGRFYGTGNVGFGITLGALVVVLGAIVALLGRERRSQAVAAVLILGLATTALNAAPQGGADFGGVPALVVVTGLVALTAAGRRWTPAALVGLGLGALALAAAVMVADWARGAGNRTHLGDFVQAVLDGEAVGIVTRKLEQSLGILISYPISWLVVLVLVALVVAVVRRAALLEPLWSHHGLRSVVLAGLVGTVLAWVLNDSGIAAAAGALTMMIAAGLITLAPAGADAAGTDAAGTSEVNEPAGPA